MTPAERAGALDDALEQGYQVFDGLILGERDRNRADRNANPAANGGLGGDPSANGGGIGGAGLPQTLPGSDVESGGPQVAVNAPVGSSRPQEETFPPPEDIPSGRDDDVVARQIREAAMREPDPELREALWEEYRNYTGINE